MSSLDKVNFKNSFNGLLLVNKPSGITSHDLVAKARRALNIKSVGHSGTLDPLASGLMVLLLGEATKLSQFFLEKDKSYILTAKFGIETDTLDTTGQVLKQTEFKSLPLNLEKQALELQGEMDLKIPIFSAAKIDGKKLYEYARNEEAVEIPLKKMSFFDLKILGQGPDWLRVEMSCSKGSFVRSWVSLLGEKAQLGAAMSELIRTKSEPFDLRDAIDIEELESLKNLENLSKRAYVPMASCLPHLKFIRVKGMDEQLMRNGQISHSLRTQLISMFNPAVDEFLRILNAKGELLALIGIEPRVGFVIKRVFHY